jgi:hypothetical protein
MTLKELIEIFELENLIGYERGIPNMTVEDLVINILPCKY